MEVDETFRKYREGQARFHKRLEEIRAQGAAILSGLESHPPTSASAAKLANLGGELEALFQGNLKQTATFTSYMLEIEEKNRKAAAMAEKRSTPERNQAQIAELSQELSTKLRLDRIDGAIKEVLDFLADAEFLAANASIGRKRRLRTLQNAIEKALPK